jgi:putative ABC transport system substrate-binding protein
MNTRRKVLIACVAASIPRMVIAQAKKPPVVIGWLSITVRSPSSIAIFKEAMTALGWTEGSGYVLEERWSQGTRDRLMSLAEELAAKKPVVIVTTTSSATIAAAKAAPAVAVVQAGGNSPVNVGLAASLARPGGMVTGLTSLNTEISEKSVELLLAAAPKLKRIGFMLDRNSPGYATFLQNSRIASERAGIEARFAEVARPEDIEPAMARFAKEGVEALVILGGGGVFTPVHQRAAAIALAHRWPIFTGSRTFVERGALMSYGSAGLLHYRQAAHYVDRILKGAKPGDLPIEQPMTFDLTVNLKTAKALGLTLPPEIMVRVTSVVQ